MDGVAKTDVDVAPGPAPVRVSLDGVSVLLTVDEAKLLAARLLAVVAEIERVA